MELEILRSRIELLDYLINRECGCVKSRCAEHFMYLKRLKFEYEVNYEQKRLSTADTGIKG